MITNDEFESLVLDESINDRVVGPIISRAWTFYSDLRSQKLDPRLSQAMRSDVARWILFLQTDLKYGWPPGPLDRFPIVNWPLNLLTLGWWERRKVRLLHEWEQHGDVSIWPFLQRAELEAACATPRFLAGSPS